MGESHGVGTGPEGLAGAAGAWAAGGVEDFGGTPAFSEGEECSVPGIGSPAAGFGSPVGGGVGDLVSSDIANAQTSNAAATHRRTLTSNSLQTGCQSWGRRVVGHFDFHTINATELVFVRPRPSKENKICDPKVAEKIDDTCDD